jgi:hypothetical protein
MSGTKPRNVAKQKIALKWNFAFPKSTEKQSRFPSKTQKPGFKQFLVKLNDAWRSYF